MKGEVREEARFGLGSILPTLSDSRMGVSSATGPHTGRIRPQAKRIRRGERVRWSDGLVGWRVGFGALAETFFPFNHE